jgi:predicted outer membrane repeat protein
MIVTLNSGVIVDINFLSLILCLVCFPAVKSYPSEPFKLKKSVESLQSSQSLDIPPGYYTSLDCGIDVQADNVTIKSSMRNVVIDCLGMARHFNISGSNVTIEGLLLLNGTSPTDTPNNILDGGCILIQGNNTVIRDSSFVNCWAAENGGAISVSNMKTFVRLAGVNIRQSNASLGGGVWSRGLLTLDNCTLTFNTARLHGGAVFIQGPNSFLTVRQTIISSNTAYGGCGGGISMMVQNITVPSCPDQLLVTPDGGGAILNECTMQNNLAAKFGGAIFSQDGFALFLEGNGQSTRFEKNVASRGGAVFAFYSRNFSVLGSVKFLDNTAYGLGDGGALCLRCSSIGTIVGGDVIFENNVASIENAGYGGAIFLADMTTLDVSGNVSIISSHALTGYGGAIYLQESALKVSGNVRFVGNIAIGGGGIFSGWSSELDLSGDVQFIDNGATQGGGIDVETGTTGRVGDRVSFVGNRGIRLSSYIGSFVGISPLMLSMGGAIFVQTASLDIWGSVSLENNTADLGGAVFLDEGAELTAGDSVSFRGGVAASGGAFYIRTATASFGGDTNIQENVAKSGGGLFVRFYACM